MTDPRNGRVRCTRCGEFYDIDEGHTCPSNVPAAAFLRAAVVNPATVPAPETLPDPDDDTLNRSHPAGLTWVSPLTPRPIPLGPSEDHPDLRPALALDAGRFWSHAGHGLAVGRARFQLDDAALRYAFSADLRRAPAEVAALAQAATAWDTAITAYTKDLCA